jgi:tetrapyrrole methylase family protein/MazG family protein
MPRELEGLAKAVETVRALRGEQGCPWDRAQTHESLRKCLLEETYEVLEALDALHADPSEENTLHLREELGDLLLQVLLHSEISRQGGGFSVAEVAGELSAKLIRRHPHVFGKEKLQTPEAVVGAWEKNKIQEKPRNSVLEGIPAAMPALQRALKVIEKVSKVGFQWPDLEGPLEKMNEELREFHDEVKALGSGPVAPEAKRGLEAELGDLLFTVANVAHFLKLNPEDSLRSMLLRFEARFRNVEEGARRSGKKIEEMSLEEMDQYWNEAKRREKGKP